MSKINESDAEWAAKRLGDLGASLEIPPPGGDDHLGNYTTEVIESHRRRRVLVGVAAMAVVVLGVGAFLAGRTSSTPVKVASNPGAQATTTPSTPTASELAQQAQDNAWKPQLPLASRKAVYEAQLAWAQCLRSNGFADVTDPDPNFGDGNTPAMHVGIQSFSNSADTDAQTYARAEAACTVEHQTMLDAVKAATSK